MTSGTAEENDGEVWKLNAGLARGDILTWIGSFESCLWHVISTQYLFCCW